MNPAMHWAATAAVALVLSVPAAAAEKRYGLTSFEAIEINADVEVEVVDRAPVSAVATGPQASLDRLELETRDGRLIIGQRKFAGDEERSAPHGAVVIRINAANLRSATLAGAGSLTIDRLKGTRVSIGLRGPGRLVVEDIATDRLQVAMIGNGSITLNGKAKQAQMTLSGAGMVDAGGLTIDELVSDSEGAGDHVMRAVKSATITSRGVGKTIVYGRPTCTVRALGSGTVTCGTTK